MKHLFIAFIIALFFAAFPRPVLAAWPAVADPSATPTFRALNQDERVTTLKAFLDGYRSPLTDEAKNFIFYADKYQLDWKLVAAIAGVESTFGRHIPTKSYNAWGWAVFTGKQSGAVFKSWEQGIATVSYGLRKHYLDRGANSIEQIGQNYAASPAWPGKVRFFLAKLEEFAPDRPALLSITI